MHQCCQHSSKTQQALGLKISASAITCLLRKQGLQHLAAKVVPMLTAKQKLARVTFAKAALRREKESTASSKLRHKCKHSSPDNDFHRNSQHSHSDFTEVHIRFTPAMKGNRAV